MKFTASIDVMPKKEILDPQGRAVQLGLENLGLPHLHEVRIGKHLTLTLEADTEAHATEMVESACKKLLANLIMEDYSYKISVV